MQGYEEKVLDRVVCFLIAPALHCYFDKVEKLNWTKRGFVGSCDRSWKAKAIKFILPLHLYIFQLIKYELTVSRQSRALSKVEHNTIILFLCVCLSFSKFLLQLSTTKICCRHHKFWEVAANGQSLVLYCFNAVNVPEKVQLSDG